MSDRFKPLPAPHDRGFGASDPLDELPVEWLSLPLPEAMSRQDHAAIQRHEGGLREAMAGMNGPATLTKARSLVELVCKVVLNLGGCDIPRDIDPMMSAARDALAMSPAHLSGMKDLRTVAGKAQAAVSAVCTDRNSEGDAHGQVRLPGFQVDDVLLVGALSLWWCRWMLSRVDRSALMAAPRLVTDLDSDQTFYKGELARRLQELGLDAMEEAPLEQLGVAVGRRAAGGTYNVFDDGIAPLLQGRQQAPAAYIRGVMRGLLLDINGQVRLTPEHTAVAELGSLLADGGTAAFTSLAAAVKNSSPAVGFQDARRVVEHLYFTAHAREYDGGRDALMALGEELGKTTGVGFTLGDWEAFDDRIVNGATADRRFLRHCQDYF